MLSAKHERRKNGAAVSVLKFFRVHLESKRSKCRLGWPQKGMCVMSDAESVMEDSPESMPVSPVRGLRLTLGIPIISLGFFVVGILIVSPGIGAHSWSDTWWPFAAANLQRMTLQLGWPLVSLAAVMLGIALTAASIAALGNPAPQAILRREALVAGVRSLLAAAIFIVSFPASAWAFSPQSTQDFQRRMVAWDGKDDAALKLATGSLASSAECLVLGAVGIAVLICAGFMEHFVGILAASDEVVLQTRIVALEGRINSAMEHTGKARRYLGKYGIGAIDPVRQLMGALLATSAALLLTVLAFLARVVFRMAEGGDWSGAGRILLQAASNAVSVGAPLYLCVVVFWLPFRIIYWTTPAADKTVSSRLFRIGRWVLLALYGLAATALLLGYSAGIYAGLEAIWKKDRELEAVAIGIALFLPALWVLVWWRRGSWNAFSARFSVLMWAESLKPDLRRKEELLEIREQLASEATTVIPHPPEGANTAKPSPLFQLSIRDWSITLGKSGAAKESAKD